MSDSDNPGATVAHVTVAAQQSLRWRSTDGTVATIRFFPDTGVVDYPSARPYPQTLACGLALTPDGPLPRFGQPLVIDLDRGSVFWRSGNELRRAPITRSAVDWAAAEPVRWSADDSLSLAVIEHNLCQLVPAQSPVPELMVARIDAATLSLSINRIIVDSAGMPIIGEHYDQPLPQITDKEQIAFAALQGGTAGARLWTDQLSRGPWRLLNGQESALQLRSAGFAVPAVLTGGRNAFTGAAADQVWGEGWYGGTRSMAVVMNTAPTTGQHAGEPELIEPSDPAPVVASSSSGTHAMAAGGNRADSVGCAPAGAWSRHDRVGEAAPCRTHRAASAEPLLQTGLGPLPGSEGVWLTYCRRCGARLSSVTSGLQRSWRTISGGVWCPSSPDPTHSRLHAPTRGIDTDHRLDLVVEHLRRVHDVDAAVVQPREPQAARMIEVPTDFGPVLAFMTHSAPGHLLVQRADGSTWRFTRWSSWDTEAAARVLGALVPEIQLLRGQQFVTGLVTLLRAARDDGAPTAASGHVWSVDLPGPHRAIWEERVRLFTGAAQTTDPLAPVASFLCPFPLVPDRDGRKLGFALDALSVWLESGKLLITNSDPQSRWTAGG